MNTKLERPPQPAMEPAQWRPGRPRRLRRVLIVVGAFALLVGVLSAAVAGVNSWLQRSFRGPVAILQPSSYGMNLVLSPDGATAYVTEPADDAVAVFDVRTRTETALVPVGHGPAGLALTPDGRELWVANADASELGTRSSVTVISTATNQVVGTAAGIGTLRPGALDVAFTPDGRTAYVTEFGGVQDGGVAAIDTASMRITGQLSPSSGASWNPTSVAVSPDGKQVWISALPGQLSSGPGSVDVFSTATGDQVAQISVGAAPYYLSLSHDGRDAYVADKVGCNVQMIDTRRLATVGSIPAPSGDGCPLGIAIAKGTVLAVTGDERTFSLGDRGDALETYDVASRRVSAVRLPGTNPVTVTLSPDGTTAFVVDADHPVVDIVSVPTGQVVGNLRLRLTPPGAPTSRRPG